MNSFYYGKSGKGDLTPNRLPKNRWELFWEMLGIRFGSLVCMNLLYMLVWLPAIFVLVASVFALLSAKSETGMDLQSFLLSTSMILVPCVAITGPFTAGMTYVTRNWARDQHSFMLSDFRDAIKNNWKQGLALSVITGLLIIVVPFGYFFYGNVAATMPILAVAQVLIVAMAVLWSLMLIYAYPLAVTYQLKMKDLLKNAALLSIGYLPMTFAARLLHCVPAIIAMLALLLSNTLIPVIVLALYYIVLGFGLSRFVTASVSNAAFDKFINTKIDGAIVNRGLAPKEQEK